MIDPTFLPTWSELYSRMGAPQPRQKRGKCLIHGGDSPTSVALDHDRGLYYCHVCHSGGDKISFVQQVLKTDFLGALRFFGIEPGKPPQPDPEIIRKRKARAGLLAWAKKIGREIRYELYVRNQITVRAMRRLRLNPEDSYGWNWLSWALKDLAALEFELDRIEGSDADKLDAFREWRAA